MRCRTTFKCSTAGFEEFGADGKTAQAHGRVYGVRIHFGAQWAAQMRPYGPTGDHPTHLVASWRAK